MELHLLERTSPKGGPFIGYCMKCGKQGILLADAIHEPCVNPSKMSDDEALILAIEGPENVSET